MSFQCQNQVVREVSSRRDVWYLMFPKNINFCEFPGNDSAESHLEGRYGFSNVTIDFIVRFHPVGICGT